MDTTFSVKQVIVNSLSFGGQRLDPIWDVTIVVGVESEFGPLELTVRIERAATLDSSVGQAMQAITQWGSRFGEFARRATSAQVQ